LIVKSKKLKVKGMARCAFLVPGSGFRVQGQEIGQRAKQVKSEKTIVNRK